MQVARLNILQWYSIVKAYVECDTQKIVVHGAHAISFLLWP